jgi:predicted nucleic acid-binding protein
VSEKKNSTDSNPFILHSVYPDADAIFGFEPEPLHVVIKDCLVVLDTNVLLVPYGTRKDSLEEIRKTYSSLVAQNRLAIPGRVAREFAQNRSEKLKTVYQQISQKRNVAIKRHAYPLLESIPEYQELVQLEQEIDTKLSQYRKAIAKLLDAITGWYWNDPVSALYRELFTAAVVFDPAIVEKTFLEDIGRRQLHKIPPGYKDAGKTDLGVGDLLIWNAILDLGKSRASHVVFVSGDEKGDWWHQSENQALFPRFELVDEFRRVSGGKSFYIISFAQLLKLFGASESVVREVQQEEAVMNVETPTSAHAELMGKAVDAERAVHRWLLRVFPGSEIEIGGLSKPDFIVKAEEEAIGFEVKYIGRGSTHFLGRVRAAEEKLARSSSRLGMTGNLVLVIGADGELEQVIRLLRRYPEIAARVGIIVGTLIEGYFAPAFRMEPPQRGPAE